MTAWLCKLLIDHITPGSVEAESAVLEARSWRSLGIPTRFRRDANDITNYLNPRRDRRHLSPLSRHPVNRESNGIYFSSDFRNEECRLSDPKSCLDELKFYSYHCGEILSFFRACLEAPLGFRSWL